MAEVIRVFTGTKIEKIEIFDSNNDYIKIGIVHFNTKYAHVCYKSNMFALEKGDYVYEFGVGRAHKFLKIPEDIHIVGDVKEVKINKIVDPRK